MWAMEVSYQKISLRDEVQYMKMVARLPIHAISPSWNYILLTIKNLGTITQYATMDSQPNWKVVCVIFVSLVFAFCLFFFCCLSLSFAKCRSEEYPRVKTPAPPSQCCRDESSTSCRVLLFQWETTACPLNFGPASPNPMPDPTLKWGCGGVVLSGVCVSEHHA